MLTKILIIALTICGVVMGLICLLFRLGGIKKSKDDGEGEIFADYDL